MANAAVTITGTPENPIFNFDIPQGEKGDPGGFTTATNLASNNLNTIITPGLYKQDYAPNVTLANNYASSGMGIGSMLVYEVVPGYVIQEYRPVSSGRRSVYARSMENNVWSNWRVFSSTRVDQTAGRAIYQWDDLNSREQLIYGDTGLRSVPTLINANWKLPTAGGHIYLSRIGREVFVSAKVEAVTPASAALSSLNQIIENIPLGFKVRTSGNALGIATWISATGNVTPQKSGVVTINGGAALSIAFPSDATNWAAGNGATLALNYITDDPWPTTLPGTAIGTIPNL